MIIHLHDKRRQAVELLQKFQHVLGGFPLMLEGLEKLKEGTDLPIAGVEIAVATVVLATFAREVRAEIHSRRHHGSPKPHSPFGWFDLAAGGLLIFEAFHGAHLKAGYLRPQFFSGLVTIALGLFHAQLHRLRSLKLDDIGLQLRRGFRRPMSIRWNDLARIDLTGPEAVFHRRDGTNEKMPLKRLHNAAAVIQAIADHAGEAGVPAVGGPGKSGTPQ